MNSFFRLCTVCQKPITSGDLIVTSRPARAKSKSGQFITISADHRVRSGQNLRGISHAVCHQQLIEDAFKWRHYQEYKQ